MSLVFVPLGSVSVQTHLLFKLLSMTVARRGSSDEECVGDAATGELIALKTDILVAIKQMQHPLMKSFRAKLLKMVDDLGSTEASNHAQAPDRACRFSHLPPHVQPRAVNR